MDFLEQTSYVIFMEYVDVYTEAGDLSGERLLKSEVHQKGIWHKTVHVWITDGLGNLLIQLRAPTKENCPNMWDISAAGHISAGETAVQAAQRETQEELGLELAEIQLQYLFTVKSSVVLNRGTYFDNEYNEVYIVLPPFNLEEIKLAANEVVEVKWISLLELEDMINKKDPNLVSHPEENARLLEYLKR